MKNIWILLLLPLVANSDTTGNLITNGTFDNGTTGWSLSGDAVRINDCCPGGHDVEFGDYGSIEQNFNLYSDTITQPMLNNGITLNSTVEVQNGEGGVGGWTSGSADTFTIRLQIKDDSGNVLATTTQERTDVTGINGENFTDSLSYTGINSNIGNIFISGSDGDAPANLGGPNVDNISVTMTYDPTVLSLEQKSEINTAVEKVEEVKIEEYKFEEVKFTEVFKEEIKIEEEIFFEEEIKLEEKEFIEETIVLSNEVIEEEVYEEEVVEETEGYTEVVESTGGTVETQSTGVSETAQDDSGGVEITVEEISVKVAEKIKTIDGQLRATQMIVAKVMAKNDKISSYSNVNSDIFIQPELQSIDIGTYTNATYTDIRNIYPNQTYEDTLWTSR